MIFFQLAKLAAISAMARKSSVDSLQSVVQIQSGRLFYVGDVVVGGDDKWAFMATIRRDRRFSEFKAKHAAEAAKAALKILLLMLLLQLRIDGFCRICND